VEVVENRTRGVKTGVEHTYACDDCGHTFTVEDGLGMTLSFVVGGVFGLGALWGLPDLWSSSWLAVAGLAGAGLIGWASVALAVVRFVNRLRHPKVEPPEGWEAAM